MHKLISFVLVSACSVSCLASDDTEQIKAFQGTWKPVKAELAGMELPEQLRQSITLKIDGNKYEVTIEGVPNADRGTWKIDTSVTPHRMTISSSEGPNKGKSFRTIYKFKDGKLTVCYDLGGDGLSPGVQNRGGHTAVSCHL